MTVESLHAQPVMVESRPVRPVTARACLHTLSVFQEPQNVDRGQRHPVMVLCPLKSDAPETVTVGPADAPLP